MLAFRFPQRFIQCTLQINRGHFKRLGDRHGNKQGAFDSQRLMRPKDLDDFFGRVNPNVDWQSTAARIERRQLVTLITDDRHAVSFQPLARGCEIENDLCAGTHNDDWCGRERGQVSRDVRQGPAMNATNAAGREYFYPRALSNPAGRSDSCRPIPFLRDGDGKIADTDLSYFCVISDEADLIFG